MNIDKIYVGDLRIVLNYKVIDNLGNCEIQHKHLKYVFVKSNVFGNYKDILSNENYNKTAFVPGNTFISSKTIIPLREYINSDSIHIKKRKVLSLNNELNKKTIRGGKI